MTSTHQAWLLALFLRLTQPKPTQSPSDWVAQNVRFSEPECNGPFSFDGREYLRDIVDDWGDDDCTDQTLCCATRMGKTRTIYGGLAYRLWRAAVRVLYVKPHRMGTAGAQDDSRNRFTPMVKKTEPLAAMIPRGGNSRHLFSTFQQRIGGSIVDWTGSNSVGALASNPCQIVVQDETDKFNTTRRRSESGEEVEADASSLADERLGECPTPKRVKASTPTLASGLIWSKLMKSDVRRYFMPCPHCDKPVVFAWSKEFTILPKTGKEAYLKWDPAAKRADGTWDESKVKATAHAECPHCQGKILDTHKGWMIREAWLRKGQYGWIATQVGTPGHRGYHLPRMYGMHRAGNFGEMAVQFLTEVNSLKGAHGFINSALAEPYEAQSSASKRTELILSRIESVKEWRKLQTIDCQARSNPTHWQGLKDATGGYFYFVIRAHAENESHAIAASGCDSWDDLRAAQTGAGVNDVGVFIDSGWGARDDAEVYRQSARFSEIIPAGGKAMCIGWMPTKGMPMRKRWKDRESGLMMPYQLRDIDPFEGTSSAGRVFINLLEFSAEFFKDIMANMRKGMGGYKWSVEEAVATETYWRHMDGQHKVALQKPSGVVENKWVKRHREWPDHIYACEYAQIAGASFMQILPIETIVETKERK